MSRFDFEFDFDHWRELAERDPAAFFAARKALLDGYIESAPERLTNDLRTLQAAVDHYRAESGTPVVAVARLMGMIGDHLGALSGHMNELRAQSALLVELLPKEER